MGMHGIFILSESKTCLEYLLFKEGTLTGYRRKQKSVRQVLPFLRLKFSWERNGVNI